MAKDLKQLLDEYKRIKEQSSNGIVPNILPSLEEQEDIELNKTMDSMPELRKIRGVPGNLGESDPAAIDPNREPNTMSMGDVTPIDYKKDEEESKPDIMFGQNLLSTVNALEQAQKARDFNQLGADAARYGGMIGSAISGIENKGLKEIANTIEKRADQPIQDFKAQVEIQKKDPNSSVSKGYKALLEKQMGMKLGGDVSASDIEPFLTAQMKKAVEKQVLFQKGGVDEQGNMLTFDPKTGEYKSTGTKAQDQMFQVKDPLTGVVNLVGRRAGAEGGLNIKGQVGGPKESTGEEESTHELYQTLDDKKRTKVDKTREDFLKDTAEDRNAVVASGGIRSMLAAGKEMDGDVLRAIQNQLARANGEKGTMTEGDVQGFGGKADILSRLGRFASMNLIGEMTDSDRQFLSKLADVMERRANEYVNQQSRVYSDNTTKVTGLEDDKARTLLGVEKTLTSNRGKSKNSTKKKEADVDSNKVTVEKDGKRFRLPKLQLEAALKQGYSLVEEE